MRLVVSWLREFVDVKASAEEIADKLGFRGFEVASIEPLDGGDAVIDFEVTANRPDCLSVVGFAREVATAYDTDLHLPSSAAGARVALASIPTGSSSRLSVTLEDAELCPRYAAAVVDAAPAASPAWMTARLQASGLRPISAIVDITNYVLIELGHPTHAFDLATLADGQIRPRRAKPGETIRTLDGVERKLDPDMLVIADRDRAQAVAGVMGGADSEVSGSTKTVAIESAYFKPTSVRRTSKRLGLKTEASSRFERGADINAAVTALQRIVALIHHVGAGQVIAPLVDAYPSPRQAQQVHMRRKRLAALLGVGVPDRDVERILRRLGLQVTATDDGWDVAAPTFRVDLLREVDLIEEVGRHYGFDRLATAFPAMTAPAAAPDARIPRDQSLRHVLTAAGVSEAVTFGFIEAKAAEAFAFAGALPAIEVANPLSAKFDTLRPSLIPGLVDALAHNRRHGRTDVRLFEIGTRFSGTGETRGVAFAWTGNGGSAHWSIPPREVDFFDAKGLAEAICQALGVTVRFEPAVEPFLVAGQTASIVAGGEGAARVGVVGQIVPAVADARGLPKQDRVFVAELDLDALQRAHVATSDAVRPLPRYPFVVRDLSIIVPDVLPAEIIHGTIQAAAPNLPAPLVAIGVFDRYKGKGVPEGSVSLSLRLTFQAEDRTLTDAEVQQSFDTILAALVKTHGAVQR